LTRNFPYRTVERSPERQGTQEQTLSIGTTGDIETIRKLADTIERHRGDEAAWSRLGAQLYARRTLDGYGNRRKFERERLAGGDLNYKYCYDLEGGKDHIVLRWGRTSFPVKKMPAIAAAYAVTVESIGATLDGGDLVPAAAPGWTADPPPEVRMSGVLSDAAIAAAAPLATAILMHLRGFPPGHSLPGREIFLDGAPIPGLDAGRAARRWDDHDYMTVEGRVWLIAALQVDMETTARADSNVG
jgi:hypothetical protein